MNTPERIPENEGLRSTKKPADSRQAGARSLIEAGFDIGWVSQIAEAESWRKEVFRPVYHVHKWWAKRLGSVFRSLIIAADSLPTADIKSEFYKERPLSEKFVFDPFMGSGTTVGEALKLGFRAAGRDINPVAEFLVRVALQKIDRTAVVEVFERLEKTVGEKIKSYSKSFDREGRECDVLYYFWVKQIPCEACARDVDLFSNYVFSKHAYPKKHPDAKIVCPKCSDVISDRYDTEQVKCKTCEHSFNPQMGNADRLTAECLACGHDSKITHWVKKTGQPPKHRMYAKMILTADGKRDYLPITEYDLDLYRQAQKDLTNIPNAYPVANILEGHNTNQARNYGYLQWHQMFNDRQLLCLSWLAKEISDIEDHSVREFLFCLFSGVLEFNNMFASFKGEGTGAVRHMFSHHILKPERTPLEASVWGTPKSSGSFSTLFERRMMKALDYKESPFEVAIGTGSKSPDRVLAGNHELNLECSDAFDEFVANKSRLYLSCGSSAKTDFKDKSVDFVITDPPFFDNVHYSELADFFYVWQSHFLARRTADAVTTRNQGEVQDRLPDAFSGKLKSVLSESWRVLKDDGLLIFSYHHSREEGWSSVAKAVLESGFAFVNAFPIKAEMSVATPKSAAKEPINFDIILVCKKRSKQRVQKSSMFDAEKRTRFYMKSLNEAGFTLSRNDIRVSLMGQLLVTLSDNLSDRKDIDPFIREHAEWIERQIEQLAKDQKAKSN